MARLREAIMNAIPVSLKRAIGVGIGLFILFIGFNAAGIVKTGPPGVPLTLGDLTSAPVAVSLFGLLLMLWFQARGTTGGLLLGIIVTTALAMGVNAWTGGRAFPLPGQAVVPARLLAWPDFSSLGAGFDFSVFARVGVLTAVVTIFSIMLSDFFDTMGTVIGVGAEAKWLTADGRLPRLNRVLLVDSLAAVAGGARTGLASVVTGGCFLLALFFAPVAGVVPAQATAPALILVGFLMIAIVREIPFGELDEGFPALLTLAVMPFTYSITNGIGAGFVAYCFIKVVRGKGAQVRPMMFAAAAANIMGRTCAPLPRTTLMKQ